MTTFTKYQNTDGTYTSPRNGKTYRSEKAFRAHWFNNSISNNWKLLNSIKVICKFCAKSTNKPNLTRHEAHCYLNPNNIVNCLVCDNPIKNYKSSKGTCSRSCANTHFRSGEGNGNWKNDTYQTTCWLHHKKECVVCGESNIVAVHHFDHNHYNNDPANLVPLCPTHHQYIHSRHRHLIEDVVQSYVSKYKNGV